MPREFPGSALTLANSTTYADLLGVTVGLERLPGEDAGTFTGRVRQAARADRSATYWGLLNETLLQFGLQPSVGLTISSTRPEVRDLDILVDCAGIQVRQNDVTTEVPLVTAGPDDFWSWRKISEVVAALNQIPGVSAVQPGSDGPALELVRQTNIRLEVAEPISGKTVVLSKKELIPGSESFNFKVPAYTRSGNVLYFSDNVPPGTTATYRYRTLPFDVLRAPVALFSFQSPDFQRIAQTADGAKLVYQVRDLLSEIATRDRSYWGR